MPHRTGAAQAQSLGEWIRNWRKAADWTQGDLASRLDVRQATVSRWENGELTPDPAMLLTLHTTFVRAGLNPPDPPVIGGRKNLVCRLAGTIHQEGIVQKTTELVEVELPPGLGDRPITAYRLDTGALAPFQQGWLFFTPDVRSGVDREECLDKLCVVAAEAGTFLGTLREVGGSYMLERVNASALPLPKRSVAWAARVLDIRPM